MDKRTRKKQMSLAYRYSLSRLALNYYTFYESVWEQAEIPDDIKEAEMSWNRILKVFLDGGDALSDLDALRRQVIHNMEILTAYTDCFQIYEYVLDRQERKFRTCAPVTQSVESFATDLADSIMSFDDAAITNSRIQEMMGQLPVRFTKQKFFSLLKERFTVYTGAGKRSLEDVLYMLRTSSMVSLPADMEGQEMLADLLRKLRETDYRNLDKTQYENCMDCVTLASQKLNEDSGLYLILEDMINDLYVLWLSGSESVVDVAEDQNCRKILSGIWQQFQEQDGRTLDDEITELLESLEGVQESAMERFLANEGEKDETLETIEKLLSGSPFVSLETDEKEDEPADPAWIEEKTDQFCEELTVLFSGMQKAVVRAVMAKILSYLPSVFRSYLELRDYIIGSLGGCTDAAEREASMEILKWELMDEDALV